MMSHFFRDFWTPPPPLIRRPIFYKLPTPYVLFCPILLDPPSPPKIGHHLCTFPYLTISQSLILAIKN